jgi:biopolymer transport protein ExbB
LPASERIRYILGAGLAALIIVSGPAPGRGQTPQDAAAPPQSIAPAPALSPPAAPPSAGDPSQAAPPLPPTAEPPANALPAVEQTASAVLPQDLTPLGMFMSADIIVKAVMLGLIFASVLTWTIWLAKSLELWGARRRVMRAQRVLEHAPSFAEAVVGAQLASRQVGRLIVAVETEFRRSPDLRDTDGIKERIAARFERIEAAVGRRMMRATGILATIGATAPFVGLFGTVWGIMNSFIGISKLHTTNLAVVAPGIAEALLATACGLAAAIPAVVIYNSFARSIARFRALYADASVEILALVGRDLSQQPGARVGPLDPRVRPLTQPAAESSR